MSCRTVAHAVIALALAWRLTASLVGVAVEIGADDSYGRSLRERFAAIDEPHAIRRRRTLGFADQILGSVEQQVPPEGVIALLAPAPQRNALLARAAFTTLWPRRIDLFENFATADIEGGFAGGRPLFVLALDAEAFAGQECCVQLVGGKSFGLWRAKGAGR